MSRYDHGIQLLITQPAFIFLIIWFEIMNDFISKYQCVISESMIFPFEGNFRHNSSKFSKNESPIQWMSPTSAQRSIRHLIDLQIGKYTTYNINNQWKQSNGRMGILMSTFDHILFHDLTPHFFAPYVEYDQCNWHIIFKICQIIHITIINSEFH